MKPSTSLETRSNVGIAKPSPAVRQTGNMRCLLVMGGVYRSSVPSGGTQVKYRRRCRVNAEPGAILTGRQREFCRTWRNQTEVTVEGIHFVQEDSPDQIGEALAGFVRSLRNL